MSDAAGGDGGAPDWARLLGPRIMDDAARRDFVLRALTGRGPEGAPPPPDLPTDLLQEAVALILSRFGQVAPEALHARRGAILHRAAARLAARATPGPATLRHPARPGDVRAGAAREPYAAFFTVEEAEIAWRRFDGGFSAPATRAAFISGDAVTVLPWDPLRDRVLVVEQFRAGPFVRGDTQPWQIEAVAGRIDPGETPEAAARREAIEEAGLTLGALHRVARYYPSPGILAEYIHSFVALCELPDGMGGLFGLAEEHEDIRAHLIPRARMMALVASGEIDNAPLILTALWLDREAARLASALRAGQVRNEP